MAELDRTLHGSIELTQLKHIRFKTKKGTLGTFIPDEQGNHLEILKVEGKDDRVFINTVNWINKEENDRQQIGSVKQTLSSKAYKAIKESESEERAKEIGKELPYLGNLKDFSNVSESTGSVASGTFDESSGDDLPF